MKVRKIDSDGDWNFGLSNANYIRGSEAVRQNVATRLKSFRDDWFLDMDAEIDWLSILGNKNNENTILYEVERVTKETEGIKTVDKIDIITINKRSATIQVEFTTIYDESFLIEVNV
jgi:hypothetical protein